MKLDLMQHPLVIEVYTRDAADDPIYIKSDDHVRQKFVNCSVRDAVDYVCQNYVRNEAGSDITKREIEEILTDDPDHIFEVYGNRLTAERDPSGTLLNDHRQDLINNSLYFKEDQTQDTGKTFLRSEIRIYDSDSTVLGGLLR